MAYANNHDSELSRIFDRKAFEIAFDDFMKKADENAESGKGRGGQIPYGFSKKPICDGAAVCTHFGQGGASKTPYLNWWVVSVYYIPDSGEIIVGIEADRYPHLDVMQIEPEEYSWIGNKKVDIAEFYRTHKSILYYDDLYECFLCVCEEVMRLGLR